MSSNSTVCPPPFLLKSDFPELGGATNSRLCVPFLQAPGMPICCLPCPKQNFFYPDRFQKIVHATVFVDLASVICCGFLLLSFAVLPIEYTQRHYLSVCLALAIFFMQLSFIIPIGAQSSQCYDRITPHDMYSSITCALSGAALLGGGWCTVMWTFLRAFSLHLQICWQIVPGRRFFLAAQAFGWSIPVALLAITLSITGVSFRFGESCHINSHMGLQTFWAPLLTVAAASIVLQAITFGYCVQVYLRSLFEEKGASQVTGGSGLPYSNSIRTVTARQAFRRIQRVVALQWRGILIVIMILADNVYFATVFLAFDGTTKKTQQNIALGFKWANCMAVNGGDKYACLDIAKTIVIEERNALAVLFLLSFNGILALLLLGRPTIYRGWYELIRNLFKRPKKEFVSYDARRLSEPGSSSYEMLDKRTDPMVSRPESKAGNGILKHPVPPPLQSSTVLEYNPATFSAKLRERAEAEGKGYSPYTRPPYSLRTPSLTSPFSSFKETQDYFASRTLHPASKRGDESVSTPPYSPYQDSPINSSDPSRRIQSPYGTPDQDIGVAK
ncbi:hypothetical protein EX30DRAFT_354765 [Ascodesmis nigricans]|uniref:G-protein coupled receptors family 2 profile 2 domain-containing protein n=1 Tax=Ascodesmis nigricans TaxID=341454 RepID=A0A4S2MYS9_9PEZI|nr:hypothetical protein EX30DRAFT_354765 [Ascodesmis nigricans]